MVNEEKVILMTRMAAFSARKGKKNAQINRYYKSDYVGLHVIRSVISAIIIFAILIGMYALYHFDTIIQDFYTGNFLAQGMRYVVFFVILVAGYSLLSFIIYSIRYKKMRKELREYYMDLKKLEKMYGEVDL